MATRLPKYVMRDNETKLGQEYFNPIWADIDNRFDKLEKLKIQWESAVAELQEFGLERIDNSLTPLLEASQTVLADLQVQATDLVQTILDNNINPVLADATALLDQAQTQAATVQAMLDAADWDQDLADLNISLTAMITANSDAITALSGSLHQVASSGDYNHLDNKPSLGSMSPLDKATTAQVRNRTVDKGLTADNISAALAWVNVAYAASLALDWKTFENAEIVQAGNITLANPANVISGETKGVYLVGNNATERTVGFGSNFKGDLPIITDVTSSKAYHLTIKAKSDTHLVVTAVRAL